MSSRIEMWISDAIQESLNGILSEHLAKARAAGKKQVRVTIPLEKLHERVRLRLKGLRQGVSKRDARRLLTPSCAKLRTEWLPILIGGDGLVLTDDAFIVTVSVPPARKAHAR